MKFFTFFTALLLFSNTAFSTETFTAKVDITTYGDVEVDVSKEVNIYGDAAKELYMFLDATAKISDIEIDWQYKFSKNIICGNQLNKDVYVCTIYVNQQGIEE